MKREIRAFILGIIATVFISTVGMAEGISKSIDVVMNSINIVVNGNKLDKETILYNDTTYVPLRAIAEMLGKDVKYDAETQTATIRDSVTVLNEQLKELESDAQKMQSILDKSKEDKIYVASDMTWPVPGYTTISTSFGNKYHPVLKVNKFSTGIGIPAPIGTDIVAANDGVVIL